MLKIYWLTIAELLSILSSKSALYTVICVKHVLYFVLPKNKSVEQISKWSLIFNFLKANNADEHTPENSPALFSTDVDLQFIVNLTNGEWVIPNDLFCFSKYKPFCC